jgi:hypothetical protein
MASQPLELELSILNLALSITSPDEFSKRANREMLLVSKIPVFLSRTYAWNLIVSPGLYRVLLICKKTWSEGIDFSGTP